MNDLTLHTVIRDPTGAEVRIPRNCCPVCGKEFDPVQAINICKNHSPNGEKYTPDELITEWDDCAWDY